MEVDKKQIIVLWDFTEKSEIALAHALRISSVIEGYITLLHVKDENLSTQPEDKITQLKNFAEAETKASNVKISANIIEGSIFESISKYVNSSEDAAFVIMGTHGMKGVQKLTGSWAYKVIKGSRVPFLLVKEKPIGVNEFLDILFPVDERLDNIEKLEAAVFLSRTFNSTIHLLKSENKNEGKRKKTNANLNLAEKFMEKSGISFNVHTLPPTARFDKATFKYAKKIGADLILVIVSDHNLFEQIFGEHEQFIMDNPENIPVMCINHSNDIDDIL